MYNKEENIEDIKEGLWYTVILNVDLFTSPLYF